MTLLEESKMQIMAEGGNHGVAGVEVEVEEDEVEEYREQQQEQCVHRMKEMIMQWNRQVLLLLLALTCSKPQVLHLSSLQQLYNKNTMTPTSYHQEKDQLPLQQIILHCHPQYQRRCPIIIFSAAATIIATTTISMPIPPSLVEGEEYYPPTHPSTCHD